MKTKHGFLALQIFTSRIQNKSKAPSIPDLKIILPTSAHSCHWTPLLQTKQCSFTCVPLQASQLSGHLSLQLLPRKRPSSQLWVNCLHHIPPQPRRHWTHPLTALQPREGAHPVGHCSLQLGPKYSVAHRMQSPLFCSQDEQLSGHVSLQVCP